MSDYYKLLGVARDANNAEIKKAYLSVLKTYHPDIYRGDKKYAESFTRDLNIAYSILIKSPEARLTYDKSIFKSCNYSYDKAGNQIKKSSPQNITESEFDTLPAFSFFNESKVSEFFRFRKSLTPQERTERKNRKKQKKADVKKQKNKDSAYGSKKFISKEDVRKSKHKLDAAIFIISAVLFCFLALIVTLNILHK